MYIRLKIIENVKIAKDQITWLITYDQIMANEIITSSW